MGSPEESTHSAKQPEQVPQDANDFNILKAAWQFQGDRLAQLLKFDPDAIPIDKMPGLISVISDQIRCLLHAHDALQQYYDDREAEFHETKMRRVTRYVDITRLWNKLEKINWQTGDWKQEGNMKIDKMERIMYEREKEEKKKDQGDIAPPPYSEKQ
jgi:hypothetical protein